MNCTQADVQRSTVAGTIVSGRHDDVHREDRYFFIHKARFLAARPPRMFLASWISSSMALPGRNLTFVSAHQELGDSRPFASS